MGIALGVVSFFLFVFFQATGIYGGDSGDLVAAAATFGVPHPPGYPLYTFLGWLLSKLPVSTPAWRAGLLSSVPHAAVVALVYSFVIRLTKSRPAGLFAAVWLAGNYLFFLYSITPEVFALFDLFVAGLAYLFVLWRNTGNGRYLVWASFVFGLSLSHHHVILFFVPAMGYFVWKNIKYQISRNWFIGLLVYWIIGLSPYLYLPIAGAGNSVINWNRPDTLVNFVRLVARSDYGTFLSNGLYGALVSQRVVQIKAYGRFLAVDLTVVGLALVLIGLWRLWRSDRRLFWFMTLGLLLLGPVFFFYASFPLVNRFSIGTYERFLLPSYTIFAVLIGVGFNVVVAGVTRFVKRRMAKISGQLATVGLITVLSMYPLATATVTLWRFRGFAEDRTADNLGRDLLASMAPDSILFLQRDTPLFTAQYMRYALGERPDVAVIQTSRLSSSDYPQVLTRAFHRLTIPDASGATFAAELVKANRDRFPIYSIAPFSVGEGWLWVPQGLVYRLLPEQDLPSLDEFVSQNEQLWQSYHNPISGILSRYNHLMLSDVRSVYAQPRMTFGRTLLRAGKTEAARKQFETAASLGGDSPAEESWTYMGLSALFLKECDAALSAFAKARELALADDPDIILYEAVTYRDCVKDENRAKELFEESESVRTQREVPLGR